MLGALEIKRTAGECTAFLAGLVGADWSAAIPDLDMTVAEVVSHAAEGCLWYAIDLAAGGTDLESVEHRVNPAGSPADLVATLATYAAVVAAVVDAAPTTARGFHPMGTADPSGFAAMACDEMLIHTDDAARGLGHRFTPPDDLAASVLRRLFPWITSGADSRTDDEPWPGLLWANGRIPLGDRPRLERWVWHCAPLEEWVGS